MNNDERALADYYNREGSDRADRELAPERVEARTRFLSAYAAPGAKSLEIGTGPGRDAAAFVAAGLVACGLDLSPVFAGLAAKSGAHVANATARALPFADASFDVVWSMSVLMHLPGTQVVAALAEIRRVLRAGAVAAIGVWGGADLTNMVDGAFGQRLFARRSELTWRPMLEAIGSVDAYEVWERPTEEFAYHWAVVRRT